MENMILFWGSASPYSQWHKRDMIIKGIKFNCCEQFMMYTKALLFEDLEIAEKILKTDSPKLQKQLGRKVRNFNPVRWNEVCRIIVYVGNLNKFSQHEDLKQMLLNTEDKLIVEASPYDNIWGIGLSANDARAYDISQWRGTNWLGYIIMKVRDKLNEGLKTEIINDINTYVSEEKVNEIMSKNTDLQLLLIYSRNDLCEFYKSLYKEPPRTNMSRQDIIHSIRDGIRVVKRAKAFNI